MKRAFSIVAIAAVLALAGCVDEAAPPATPGSAPAPAPAASGDPAPVTEGDVTVAWSRGMQILVKRTPGAEFVALQLHVKGGTRNWTKDDAGIEQLVFKVATAGGTRSLAKDAFSNKLASLGASIDGGANGDFSTIAAKAPRASYDALFPLFAETFVAPALPPSEFEIAKSREISARKHELEDGDGRLALLVRRTAFEGHPYANRSVGSVETLSAIKPESLAPHLAKLRDTQRLVLIVVGDVDPAEVVERAKVAFASVPRGAYAESKLPPLHFEKARLAGDPFKLPTNYIESMFVGPSWSDADFPAMWVGMTVLGNRVFDEVRTKRNLSYAPAAWLETHSALPYGALYVTAVDPNATMKVMFDEAHRLQSEPLPAKELEATKAVFLSGYLQAHEHVEGQAGMLAEALLYGGDWHLATTFTARMQKVTSADVQAAAKKWFGSVQTAVVGEPAKLDAKVVGAP